MSNVLKGTIMNPTVVRGKSAYEIAVDNGFKGTEQEWLESLVGGNPITDNIKFPETIYTNQDVGSVKGSSGKATLAEKGQTLTDWIKKVFGEVETEGGTEAQSFTVYCGSMKKADRITAIDLENLNKYHKKKFSARFEAEYNRFVVAFPKSIGVDISVYDDSCLDSDARDDFEELGTTITVNGIVYTVYYMDTVEELSSCFDFAIEILEK